MELKIIIKCEEREETERGGRKGREEGKGGGTGAGGGMNGRAPAART